MEENKQHFSILYYFKKGKNTIEMQAKICAVYGEGAVTDWTCQKWCAKFCARDFSLDDAPQLGRQLKLIARKVETLIENSQCSTMQETAGILKISKSIHLLVKMEMYLLFYRKKPYGLFGQPNIY